MVGTKSAAALLAAAKIDSHGWESVCLYISPIGEEGTDHRKHADLFLGSVVEPALKEFGLAVTCADKIGKPGMITAQIIEYIVKAKLVIADLSYTTRMSSTRSACDTSAAYPRFRSFERRIRFRLTRINFVPFISTRRTYSR